MDNNFEHDFVKMVRDSFTKLDDNLLTEDIDILAKYIVSRFVKTSTTMVNGMSEEYTKNALDKFIKDRFSFITTFIAVINSDPMSVEKEA